LKRIFDGLDILVNNAGIAHLEDGLPETASIEAVRAIFETNFIGTFVVTLAAVAPVQRAFLEDSGPTGGFFSANGALDR
tara:strand:+ start:219 stop:455 length:237 start_codon:yes stop_codon:yes gene_type:complete